MDKSEHSAFKISNGLTGKLNRINPHWQERQGRKSADPILASNRVISRESIAALLKHAVSFSEFQALALYHPQGYFPKKVDYRDEMPLLPQMLSPFFGKMVGELAFAGYASVTSSQPVKPSFLSLGAGRAYLDRDLIDHVTDGNFLLPAYGPHAEFFKRKSTFLITDSGAKAVSLAKKELSEVLSNPALRGRVRVAQMDALDFQLPEEPLGIIYFNELIDNLPAEPVLKIDSILYAVKVLACDTSVTGADLTLTTASGSTLTVKGVISSRLLKSRVEANDTGKLLFMPVFIPLEYDVVLFGHFQNLKASRRIDESDFGGVYPVHIGLDNLFGSIKKSFRGGIVIIIDYRSCEGGAHNWNLAVNNFRRYKFGSEDFNFQIDSAQVVEKAERNGMRCEYRTNLKTIMNQMMAMVTAAGPSDIKRNMQANGRPFLPASPETCEAYFQMHRELIEYIAPAYDVITLHF